MNLHKRETSWDSEDTQNLLESIKTFVIIMSICTALYAVIDVWVTFCSNWR